MTLKVVKSRSLPKVSEPKKAPAAAAREIQFRCSACGKHAYAAIPYHPSPETRQRIIQQALAEHRQVCAVGNAEEGRSYEIWYPRA